MTLSNCGTWKAGGICAGCNVLMHLCCTRQNGNGLIKSVIRVQIHAYSQLQYTQNSYHNIIKSLEPVVHKIKDRI